MVEKQFQATKSNMKKKPWFFLTTYRFRQIYYLRNRKCRAGPWQRGPRLRRSPASGGGARRLERPENTPGPLCSASSTSRCSGKVLEAWEQPSWRQVCLQPPWGWSCRGPDSSHSSLFVLLPMCFSLRLAKSKSLPQDLGGVREGPPHTFLPLGVVLEEVSLDFSCGVINLLPFQKSGHPPGEFIFYLLLVLFVTPPPPGKNKS